MIFYVYLYDRGLVIFVFVPFCFFNSILHDSS